MSYKVSPPNRPILNSLFLVLQALSIRAHRPLCLFQPRRRRRIRRGGRGCTSKKAAGDRQTVTIQPRLKKASGRKNTGVEPIPETGRAELWETRGEEVRATRGQVTRGGRQWRQNTEIKRRLSDRTKGRTWSSHNPSQWAEISVWQKIPPQQSKKYYKAYGCQTVKKMWHAKALAKEVPCPNNAFSALTPKKKKLQPVFFCPERFTGGRGSAE